MNILPSSSFFSELLDMDNSSKEARQTFIRQLPRLEEKDIDPGDTCAICQETLLAVIAAEEMASAMESPGLAEEDMGVVKIPVCGHVFCRKDIATWVYSSHSTCPSCRREFLPEDIARPASDSAEPDSLPEVREFIRLLQLHVSGFHNDADAAFHNPFSEGGVSTQDTVEDEQDREHSRQVHEELLRMLEDRQQEQSEPRESFGMYS
ncbi:hypothetical protein BDV93DRAFT_518592 [Ceratobasidium sp. AG-I]|nr:hypothetical protein BDV93DRAFT_518592 [Ceratobasidium sp. AG-I]